MKNIILKTLFLSFALFMVSCGGEEDPSDLSNCNDDTLTLTYNGAAYSADAIQSSLTLGSTGTLTGSISGSTVDNKTFTITIFSPNAADDSCLPIGNYPGVAMATMQENRFQARYSEDVSVGTLFNAFNGSLTITACAGGNKIVEGTFNFVDDDNNHIVTNGTFKVCLEK